MEEPTPGQRDQVDKVTRYWAHARELDGQAAEYRYMAAETITEMLDGSDITQVIIARWLGKTQGHISRAVRAYRLCVENDWPPTRFQEAYKHAQKPDKSGGDPGPQNDEPEDNEPDEDEPSTEEDPAPDDLHPDETPDINEEEDDELCPATPWRTRLRHFRVRTDKFLTFDLSDAEARTLARYLRKCVKQLEERSK